MIYIHPHTAKSITNFLTILTKIVSEVFQLLHVVSVDSGFLCGEGPAHVGEADERLLQLLPWNAGPGHLYGSCQRTSVTGEGGQTYLCLQASRALGGHGQSCLGRLGWGRTPS